MAAFEYPITAVNGSLALTQSDRGVNEGAVKSALFTRKGERVLNPQYGTEPNLFSIQPDLGSYLVDLEEGVDNSLDGYDLVVTQLSGDQQSNGAINVLLEYSSDTGLETVATYV